MKTLVITSGYFNPIHPGHIECFKLAKALGDQLIVIVNNDAQSFMKKGVQSFQSQNDRLEIVKAIKYVDNAVLSFDEDLTVQRTLASLAKIYQLQNPSLRVIFAKGGDRFASEIPEAEVCHLNNIEMVDGLGAKTHNSSDLLKENK